MNGFGFLSSALGGLDSFLGDYKSLKNTSPVSVNDKTYDTGEYTPLTEHFKSATSSSKLDFSSLDSYLNNWLTSASKVASDYASTANEYNAQQAELAFKRAQSSADKQMDFQREMFDKETAYNTLMSNTQYQRAVADLKAAGINPILAVGGLSGSVPSASSYSGSSASSSSASAYNSDVVSAINSDRSPMGILSMFLSSAMKIFEAFGDK